MPAALPEPRRGRPGTALRAILVLLALAGPGAVAAAEAPLFDGAGYRVRDFRAETGDEAPAGARTVGIGDLQALLESGALPVDVLPTPPRPATLRADALWLPPERRDIPGSLWLPDLGLPALSEVREARFRAALAPHAGRTLVAYCLANCWLSWNAAKRLVEWGFADVRWFPAGTDGWSAAGLPTEPAVPAVRPEEVR
ncbi:PQQ-dependent catabolism-associated CXXCW motif protein [Azospirillum sp. ST 5-10]|uniref:PQQ-dependent catabolism-associated CXXCW motif protein n=1 Tax=unclassified Azospirillum TaxID=2630922 RepID=UPI003F49CD98